jgi:LacI family transcriptional regulator
MSIQQVAQIAGVPYSTTWRAINRIPGVSPKVVDAVRKAADQIGYVHPARRLGATGRAAGRSRHRSIALLYLQSNTDLSISIVRAVQKMVVDRDLNLIFGYVNNPQEMPPAVQDGEVGGILGYGRFPLAAATARVREIPTVWMMSRPDLEDDQWGDRVMPDHRAIGRLAAKYLLSKGHEHLAFFNPAPILRFSCERGEGFSASATGVAKSVALLSSDPSVPYLRDGAFEQVVDRWFAANPRPTGVFSPTDVSTVAFYRHFSRRGIKPGKDVEFVSCDNRAEWLSQLDIPPVSIDLNRETIAQLAVERLLWRMREGTNSPRVLLVAPPTLPVDHPL